MAAPTGTVTIKTNHGKYICARENGIVIGDAQTAREWEQWQVIPTNNGVFLKSHHGRYLCAESNGKIIADRQNPSTWETFQFVSCGGGMHNIKTCHNKFICANQSTGALDGNAQQPKDWERFMISPVGTTYNPNSPAVQNTAHQIQHEMDSPSSNNNQVSNNNNKPPHSGTNRKKALLIGCNYIGQAELLNGPSNDVKNMMSYLSDEFDFSKANILILSDENETRQNSYSQGPMHGQGDIRELSPTKANILKATAWLVNDARAGDTLFFMYSGHGGQLRDVSGDEDDGEDEVIFPIDFKQGNHIIDDDLHTSMVKRIPDGCKLICLMDCCHSGTGLDLPFTKSAYVSKNRKPKENRITQEGFSSGTTVCFSSCQDSETSADIGVNGQYSGALTHFWLKAVKEMGGGKNAKGNPGSYEQILMHIFESMRAKLPNVESIPQMSYNLQTFNTGDIFML